MLAIAGGKGGSGKTTTALGLARALAAAGERPLVVDTDRDMPDLHLRTDVDRSPGIAALAAASSKGAGEALAKAAGCKPSPRLPGVDIVPCDATDAATLERTLASLAEASRPILLDCPAGAGPDAAAPLRAAERSILVSAPDRQSLTDTAKTAAMARALDAPPVCTALVRSTGRVDPAPVFECRRTYHLPPVSDEPLESARLRPAYDSIRDDIWGRNG